MNKKKWGIVAGIVAALATSIVVLAVSLSGNGEGDSSVPVSNPSLESVTPEPVVDGGGEEVKPTEEPLVSTEPSEKPSEEPTVTEAPAVEPTEEPKVTEMPSAPPSVKPSEEPKATATPKPTATPTVAPTATPTPAPTAEPTPEPTAVPTEAPTPELTAVPTPEPTAVPTPEPTAVPTPEPTPHVHAMVETWITYPSCTNTGYVVYGCYYCDYYDPEYTRTVPMLEHTHEVAYVIEGDCVSPTITRYRCSVCGAEPSMADVITPCENPQHEWQTVLDESLDPDTLEIIYTEVTICQRCSIEKE